MSVVFRPVSSKSISVLNTAKLVIEAYGMKFFITLFQLLFGKNQFFIDFL